MRKILILICATMILCSCGEEKKATVQSVTCEEKTKLVSEENAILIDVRSASEYNLNHLDGAINIDNQVIGDTIESQVPEKDKKIIVYCQSGTRSKAAADTLIQKGYTNVYDLGSIENCDK